MGGKAPTVEPTAEEVTLANIAADKWERFMASGMAIQNEHIARQTGFRIGEDGTMTIDPDGMLNPDGSVKTDTASAHNANESAYTKAALAQVDPNRMGNTNELQRQRAEQGAGAAGQMAFDQQTNHLKGALNAAMMIQGQETEALASQSQLAAQAQQDANQSAHQAQQTQQAQSSLAGQVAGTATGLGLHQAGLLNRTQKKGDKNHLPDSI